MWSDTWLLRYWTWKFFICSDISIYCYFWHAISPSTSRIKDVSAQIWFRFCILHNYQIYIVISCFVSRKYQSLNLTVKSLHWILRSNPNGLLNTIIKCHHFNAPHQTKSLTTHNWLSNGVISGRVCDGYIKLFKQLVFWCLAARLVESHIVSRKCVRITSLQLTDNAA